MKKIFAALLAGALAISLVACGTSSSTASVASAGDSSKVTSAPASETPTLDAIKQKGKIVMLTSTGLFGR